jgi:serine/threonine protein kinase
VNDHPDAVAELPYERLDVRLERGSLEIDEVVEIARMLAVHLDAEHDKGGIDGAIVPARIEVRTGGAPKLSPIEPQHQHQKAYLAPEAWDGHPVPASDQFSMAAILYESLCGGRAFPGDDSAKIRVSITTGSRVPLAARVPGLADAVDEVFAKALSIDPANRYASCASFADALVSAIERSREAPLVQKPATRSSRPPSWRPPPLDDEPEPPIPWLKVFVGLALLAAIAAVLALASSGK